MKLKNGDEIKQGHSFGMQMLQKSQTKITISHFHCVTPNIKLLDPLVL